MINIIIFLVTDSSTKFSEEMHFKFTKSLIKCHQKPIEIPLDPGSVLGPLYFLIYINQLPSCVSCNIRLFADDSDISHHWILVRFPQAPRLKISARGKTGNGNGTWNSIPPNVRSYISLETKPSLNIIIFFTAKFLNLSQMQNISVLTWHPISLTMIILTESPLMPIRP